MDGNKSQSEIVPKREMPSGMEAVKLESAQAAREAVEALGGHDLLSKKGILAGSPDEMGEWFGNITEMMGRHCDPIAVKDGSKFVGFMLVDHDGLIMQFWSPQEEKRSEILQRALALYMNDRHVDHFTVKLNEHDKPMRQVFLDAGFREEENEEGKVILRKR